MDVFIDCGNYVTMCIYIYNLKIYMYIYTIKISCMKRVASPRSMHDTGWLGASALGRPRGMIWGGRREEGSGWGTHVCLWRIHFDIWQNQYNIVKFKN